MVVEDLWRPSGLSSSTRLFFLSALQVSVLTDLLLFDFVKPPELGLPRLRLPYVTYCQHESFIYANVASLDMSKVRQYAPHNFLFNFENGFSPIYSRIEMFVLFAVPGILHILL